MDTKNNRWLESIKFDEQGLIPAIAQDHLTGRILMVAWMNKDAVQQSVETEKATYWSRSRRTFWVKGESSGHEQRVKAVQLDCDGDVLILKIEQVGEIACHTGRNSCFFRTLAPEGWQETEPVLKDPGEIYSDE